MGSIVCVLSLITTYLILGKQAMTIVSIWTGFQILWLMLRLVYYHLSEGAESNFPILALSSMENLSQCSKERVWKLMFALSIYEMHSHPRGRYSYQDDLQSLEEWHNSGFPVTPLLYLPDLATSENFHVTISAVIGDTTLTSAAWLRGSKLSGMDLYDSCVLLIRTMGELYSTTAARALCSSVSIITDEEAASHIVSPKGSANPGPDSVRWHYWIPMANDRWAHMTSDTNLKIIGERDVEVWNADETARYLLTAGLNISLRSVKELEEVCQLSRIGYQSLAELME